MISFRIYFNFSIYNSYLKDYSVLKKNFIINAHDSFAFISSQTCLFVSTLAIYSVSAVLYNLLIFCV